MTDVSETNQREYDAWTTFSSSPTDANRDQWQAAAMAVLLTGEMARSQYIYWQRMAETISSRRPA